ncbi:MAG: aspartate kinase, partial [Mucinivorans sp.]
MVKTLKFGGTSVGSAANMRRVADIIIAQNARLTVLSAMSGTTDALIAITGDQLDKIATLEEKYSHCINELLTDPSEAMQAFEASFDVIRNSKNPYKIIAQGEILTTKIFTLYLQQCGVKAKWLYSPDFVVKDDQGHAKVSAPSIENDTFYVTQGFICSDERGAICNLGRGGSDYSAALIGVAISSSEVQIWTDIDGMHTGDPRFVEGTHPISTMSFDEAAELAYFGAKILHPSTILPCREAKVDVLLKNTMDPAAAGTRITSHTDDKVTFLAAAAKDNITLVRITSDRMLLAYGFLRRVFEIFERHSTPIDMITTSEVAVAITVDDTTHIEIIKRELSELGHIEVETNNSIVCV